MDTKNYTAFLIRLALGFIYLSAGWAKLAPNDLGNLIGPVDISHVTDSSILLFTFQGIAIFQLITGALILSQRYSFLGLLLLFPLAFGIFAFTLIAGFGGTIFFNLIFLMMNFYALSIEKDSIQKLRQGDFSVFYNSAVTQYFPNKKLSLIAFSLLSIIVIGSFFYDGKIFNILGILTLLAFTFNFFQFKKFNPLDKTTIALFFVICFIVTNGQILNEIIDRFFMYAFYLIPIGFILYLLRILIWRDSIQKPMME